ncbi:hypothetical protein VTG60DRAFT_5595 [Thermothelomyces hinnuleus]
MALFFFFILPMPSVLPWDNPLDYSRPSRVKLNLGDLLLTPVWLDLQGWWGGPGAKQGRHGFTKERLYFSRHSLGNVLCRCMWRLCVWIWGLFFYFILVEIPALYSRKEYGHVTPFHIYISRVDHLGNGGNAGKGNVMSVVTEHALYGMQGGKDENMKGD